MNADPVEDFIARWRGVTASELAAAAPAASTATSAGLSCWKPGN
jgi:hypothetical protein